MQLALHDKNCNLIERSNVLQGLDVTGRKVFTFTQRTLVPNETYIIGLATDDNTFSIAMGTTNATVAALSNGGTSAMVFTGANRTGTGAGVTTGGCGSRTASTLQSYPHMAFVN
jgi:hypothetical protein